MRDAQEATHALAGGGEEEEGSYDSVWASHKDPVDDCDTLGILVARVSSD